VQLTHQLTIERHTAGALDAYGAPAITTLAIDITGYLEQRARGELTTDRDVGTQEALLLVGPDTVIDETDTVIDVDGVRWNVSGPPWSVRRPGSPAIHHLEATLRRQQ
jgi:hypothetical protein